MAEGSESVSFKKYRVSPYCHGCGRKLVLKNEQRMWFSSLPHRAVFGGCCYTVAASWEPMEEAA